MIYCSPEHKKNELLKAQQRKVWRRYCKHKPAALADKMMNPPLGVDQQEVKMLLIAARLEITRRLTAINGAEKRSRSLDPAIRDEELAKAKAKWEAALAEHEARMQELTAIKVEKMLEDKKYYIDPVTGYWQLI